MKKVITTFILLCIIFTPELIFSQNSLEDLTKQLQDTEKQLNQIKQDLLKISNEFPISGEGFFLYSIISDINSSEYMIANVIDLILMLPTIKDEYKPEFGIFVQHRLSSLKQDMVYKIECIQIAHVGIYNMDALNLIDKAKDPMRVSLSLFDRSIEVLNINKIKAPQKITRTREVAMD